MGKLNIEKGNRFGRLTVLKELERGFVGRQKKRFFLLRCDCGKEVRKILDVLRRGDTKSCGCYNIDIVNKRLTTHGMAGTRPYKIWQCMKERCDIPNRKAYKNYGGRGIGYPEKWKMFKGFWEDMGPSYQEGLTLDRINNNKSYSKENCRWATSKEQANNTRRTLLYKGIPISTWAEQLGIKVGMIHTRLGNGRNIEDAVLRPKGYKRGISIKTERLLDLYGIHMASNDDKLAQAVINAEIEKRVKLKLQLAKESLK